MKDTIRVELELAGKKLALETGLLACQAAGSCTLTIEDTVLFAAVTAAR